MPPLPWQHQPSLPRALPTRLAPACLVAGSRPTAWVPCHRARSPNKGASSASWLRAMDTCPLSIGPASRDFHKGQPTAGRQAAPGHCLQGPKKTKALSVRQHPTLRATCSQPWAPSCGRVLRLKVTFCMLFVPFSFTLPKSADTENLPHPPSCLSPNHIARSQSPRPVGSDWKLVTRSHVKLPPLAPHQGLQGFLVT